MQMTKEFILGSKKCRDNFKHLSCLRSGSYEDGTPVKFIEEDLDACTIAAYETLLLLIPVVSSTFALIQNLFRNVKEENVIGTLQSQWMNDDIGTVHKFQGKEAAEVIFLLGCDTSAGALPAVKWVNNNIVNVAATRAKYRLYVIRDIRAWKASKCVSRAKKIIDTYTFEAIEQELNKEQPDSERLRSLCGQIPSGPAFPIRLKKEACGEKEQKEQNDQNERSEEFVPSTAEVIEELNKANIMTRALTEEELRRFGFHDMSEIMAFSPEIQSNLLWGMKLYLLLEGHI